MGLFFYPTIFYPIFVKLVTEILPLKLPSYIAMHDHQIQKWLHVMEAIVFISNCISLNIKGGIYQTRQLVIQAIEVHYLLDKRYIHRGILPVIYNQLL